MAEEGKYRYDILEINEMDSDDLIVCSEIIKILSDKKYLNTKSNNKHIRFLIDGIMSRKRELNIDLLFD